jgi:predicted Zn-dependent protease
MLAALAARPAYPCINEVMRQDEAVKLVTTFEQALEKADYKAAKEAARPHRARIRDEKLEERLLDANGLLALRTRTTEKPASIDWVVSHFEERAKESKDVKFKAWLAEAYEAVGKSERALQLLTDLKKRDLMPDAFAYVTLARLSSKPEDRDTALAACKVRAKTKSICTVDATPKS